MRVETWRWAQDGGWVGSDDVRADLLLCFGSVAALERGVPSLAARWPESVIIGCSSAGEIDDTRVLDDTIVATLIAFSRPPRLVAADVDLSAVGDDSRRAGEEVARRLAPGRPEHVIVLAAGRHINGSALVAGLSDGLAPGVQVTGGVAADGPRFGRTVVVVGGAVRDEAIVAIGLGGDHLSFGCGSLGGWDPFGPERLVTRSRGNVLHELDGRPALELYRAYLGPHAAALPASGLLFPLVLRHGERVGVVRTLLDLDPVENSLTFAGDVPEGSYARLMKANFDRLVEGATGAARRALLSDGEPADLALLISCVGRRLVLQQRIEEELEAARAELGAGPVLTGFYSYGEICPFVQGAACELHNQTMTITTIRERA